jgi:hypothetical protein
VRKRADSETFVSVSKLSGSDDQSSHEGRGTKRSGSFSSSNLGGSDHGNVLLLYILLLSSYLYRM